MAMAKKSIESGKSRKHSSGGGGTTPPRTSPPNNAEEPQVQRRLSPVRVRIPTSPPSTSPRTSPGLLAGHYAGCKFSEPPLPSALPLPPQHWMQQAAHSVLMPFHPVLKADQLDIAQQLKVLLKVQA